MLFIFWEYPVLWYFVSIGYITSSLWSLCCKYVSTSVTDVIVPTANVCLFVFNIGPQIGSSFVLGLLAVYAIILLKCFGNYPDCWLIGY
jgi:hypothetical protein